MVLWLCLTKKEFLSFKELHAEILTDGRKIKWGVICAEIDVREWRQFPVASSEKSRGIRMMPWRTSSSKSRRDEDEQRNQRTYFRSRCKISRELGQGSKRKKVFKKEIMHMKYTAWHLVNAQ